MRPSASRLPWLALEGASLSLYFSGMPANDDDGPSIVEEEPEGASIEEVD